VAEERRWRNEWGNDFSRGDCRIAGDEVGHPIPFCVSLGRECRQKGCRGSRVEDQAVLYQLDMRTFLGDDPAVKLAGNPRGMVAHCREGADCQPESEKT
jgi:hypothetical protein